MTKALPRDGLRIAAEFARTKAEIVLAQVKGACAIAKPMRVGEKRKKTVPQGNCRRSCTQLRRTMTKSTDNVLSPRTRRVIGAPKNAIVQMARPIHQRPRVALNSRRHCGRTASRGRRIGNSGSIGVRRARGQWRGAQMTGIANQRDETRVRADKDSAAAAKPAVRGQADNWAHKIRDGNALLA